MTRKPKPEPQFADHVHYGRGQILSTRELESGHVAEVRFEDGSKRLIRLDPVYWTSDITALLPSAPKKKQTTERKPASAEPPPAAAQPSPATAQPEAA